MTTAILARCDGGGLASITREVARHLAPERTLLLDLGDQGRGECVPDDYQYGDVYRTDWRGGLSRDAVEWVTAPGVDTLWSAEFWYGDPDQPEILLAAHQRGIRTVCLAMPELAPWATTAPARACIRPREIHVPTAWREQTLPDSTLLPVPVARDRLPFRQRTEVAHLFHVTGAAMRDRNGTDLLLAALPSVTAPCRLTIRSERPVNVLPGGAVDVQVISDRCDNYWDSVPDDVDLLVMPRRYGGLCMPLIECASRGIPALTLASDPYGALPFVHTLSTNSSTEVRMKGGMVDVFSADPRALAAAIDHLVTHPAEQAAASLAADAWAEEHSWDGELGARWCRALSARCAQEEAA